MLEQLEKERIELKRIREKYSRIPQPGISVIIPTNKPKFLANIFENYNRLNYQNKELIIILNNNNMNIKNYLAYASGLNNVRIYQMDENTQLGRCLNFGIEQSKYNYFTKMDDDDFYGANYLLDLMNVFKYTDAEVTGKLACFVYFKDNNSLYVSKPSSVNQYVKALNGSTLLVKKEVYYKVKFKERTLGEDSNFLDDCFESGIKVYSADIFNYVCIRHTDLQDHTWRVTHDDLRNWCENLMTTVDFIPIVTA